MPSMFEEPEEFISADEALGADGFSFLPGEEEDQEDGSGEYERIFNLIGVMREDIFRQGPPAHLPTMADSDFDDTHLLPDFYGEPEGLRLSVVNEEHPLFLPANLQLSEDEAA